MMTQEHSSELLIRMQETPNPQALKFILNKPVKNVGKATYNSVDDARANTMACELMKLEGSTQVHMFANIITVTFEDGVDPYSMIDDVMAVIKSRYPVHNPDFTIEGEKLVKREDLPPEVQKIEEILDRTIRPGLQSDGGDVTVVSLEGKDLEIRYEGACGTCPSASFGTLQAIESILQNEYDEEIRIFLADPFY